MLHHLSIGVRDLDGARRFYDALLEPMGYVRLWTGADGLGYGPPGGGEKLNIFMRPDAFPPGAGSHIAFTAPSLEAVDRAYAAALAQGGRSSGAPGPRPHYGASYYAAFLFDPEGWKLEVVHK